MVIPMFNELIKRLRECTAEMNGEKTLWHQAADAIEELQKRKHGNWKDEKIRGDLRTVCSCCGEESGMLYKFSYCPNCGAKMENTDD